MPEYDSYIRALGLRPSEVKVVVAMSGGVDSSVAAAILAGDGYGVTGVTFDLWRVKGGREARSAPGAQRSAEDAGAVCRALGIRHRVIDLRAEFKSAVVEPFCREYLAGRTPNPCVICNPRIKFAALTSAALDAGAAFVATGHHVRQVAAASTGTYRLLKGVDPAKDQSYALWGLTQGALKRSVFPVGWLTKKEVRGFARDLDLPVADREESQDVCFMPRGGIRGLVEEILPGRGGVSSGEIRDLEENVLGHHEGYFSFTVGQRRGLNLARGRRQYVVKLDPGRNIVYVGDDEDLKHRVACVSGLNLIEGRDAVARLQEAGGAGPGLRVTAKIRYLHPGAPGWLRLAGDSSAVMFFDEPQRAITPGQSLVAYEGERVLGGGFIERAER